MALSPLFQSLRPAARDLPESGIVELVNSGRSKQDLIPLWVGEGQLPTPDFICEAAYGAMVKGDTFYTHQRGIPPLREALARYHTRQFDRAFEPERFFITGSGMQAVQLALHALAGHGDEVIIPTPAWPNFASAAEIADARAVEVPMQLEGECGDSQWVLDLDAVEAKITNRTRALFINTPGNPTGWTADEATLRTILEMCRRHGIWIVADEVYNRFYYSGKRAPSFYDIIDDDDRVIFTNTFSKNWAMTGWRVGWISAPAELGQVFENLIQFSTSGVASFLQPACVEALDKGEAFVERQVSTAKQSRDVICDKLAKTGRVHFAVPDGAFYLFFSIDTVENSRIAALNMIETANIGLAPGSAFGLSAEKYLRLCFATEPDIVSEAGDRLTNWLMNSI